MPDPRRVRLLLAILMLFAAGVFLIGINWGLPSRRVDPFLFGQHPVWTGEQIVALAPERSDARGADVDANPIVTRDRPIVLNDTDAKRAEIVRRYRLFTYQPDEMITMMSLSKIRQFNGDPRLYQYGGLWIYPVGALVRGAMLLGLIERPPIDTPPLVFYLDHPEAF